MELVFRRLRLVCCAYESLKYLDLDTWQFFFAKTDRQTRKPIALPLLRMHTRGVIIAYTELFLEILHTGIYQDWRRGGGL
jgi:hypothetical protein